MNSNVLDLIGNTALVPLRHISKDLPRLIYAKCEHLNPGGSIKDRLALSIVNDAEERGVLEPGMTLIEATAGNTGMGLALIGAVRGYHVVCVLPETMSLEKQNALKNVGAEVILAPKAPISSPDNFRNMAERMAQEKGWFLTQQFVNPANVRIHDETTGVEILEQTGGTIGAFVSGAGTGGTISGVGRRLKGHNPDIQVILADPPGSGYHQWVLTGEPGPDGTYKVEGVGGSTPPGNLHRDVIDDVEVIEDEESFAMCRRLIKEEGLLVGGSAGMNVAAAVKVAKRDGIEGPVVTVLPDSWDRYRSTEWVAAWTA